MGTFKIHTVARVVPYEAEDIVGTHIRMKPVPVLAYSWGCVITDLTGMKEAVIPANPSLGDRGALCRHPDSAALEQFMTNLGTGAFHLVLAC